MNTIPEIGSVWVYKHNEEVKATVLWADALTVVYNISRRSNNYRNTADTSSFLGDYKPKPNHRTININGTELPEPMREAPAMDEMYWFTSLSRQVGVYQDIWGGSQFDLRRLKRGIAFRTKDDALAWVEFDVKLRGGEL